MMCVFDRARNLQGISFQFVNGPINLIILFMIAFAELTMSITITDKFVTHCYLSCSFF